MILEKLLNYYYQASRNGGSSDHYDVDRLDQLYAELCEHILLLHWQVVLPMVSSSSSSRQQQQQRRLQSINSSGGSSSSSSSSSSSNRRRSTSSNKSSEKKKNDDDDDDHHHHGDGIPTMSSSLSLSGSSSKLPPPQQRRLIHNNNNNTKRHSSSLSPRHRRRLIQGKKKLLLLGPRIMMGEDETAATTTTAAAVTQQHADDNNGNNNSSNHHNMMVLQTAFRAMAATRSADKEDTGSAVAVVLRDEEVATAMTLVTFWEEAVVQVLQQMQHVLVPTLKQKKNKKTLQNCNKHCTSMSNNQQRTTAHKNNRDSQHELRDDEVFEYFCEHDILGLWVEIIQAKPNQNNSVGNNVSNIKNNTTNNNTNKFYGVVWSPRVKAQIFVTLQHMIHHATDACTLHYLFSNHAISKLLNSMLPLTQWTEQALEIMLPPFCDLLQQLTLHLSAHPQHWIPLFVVQDDNDIVDAANENNNNNCTTATTTTTSSFPLFSVTLATLCSTLAQSNSFLHATCLHLLVNLLQMLSDTMQNDNHDISLTTFTTGLLIPVTEQVTLAHHISHKLVQRYHKIASITTGPAVDAIRSTAVGTQLNLFQDDLFALNDLLLAGSSSSAAAAAWNVRLCEVVLEKCIYVWLQDLVPGATTRRPILAGVGSCDNDVIPEREALAQASMVCLTYFIEHVVYEPLLRMTAVALWYPQSCKLWCGVVVECDESNGDRLEYDNDYKWTQALNSLVAQHGKEEKEDAAVNGNDTDRLKNPYRQEIIKSLQGAYGDWRVCTAAILMEKTMEAFDQEDLWLLAVVRQPAYCNQKSVSSMEQTADQALEQYISDFKSEHLPSRVLRMALECSSSVAIQLALMYSNETYCKGSNSPSEVPDSKVFSHPAETLQESLETIKKTFFRNVMSYQEVFGVSDIFVTLIENVVCALYKHEERNHTSEKTVKIFLMNLYDCSVYSNNPEVLVRKLRSLEGSDVENCRFQIRMALHFRATSRVVRRLCQQKQKKSGNSNTDVGLPLHRFDPADDLAQIFTSLQQSPEKGSEIDLSGRMIFSCSSTINLAEVPSTSPGKQDNQATDVGRVRTLSWDMILRPSSKLTLVLDPTHICVVKILTTTATESKRGVILCSIPLLQVIAAATDGDTLHIAVQHDNVGGLIQNGNMTLCFPSTGTTLVVQQYLDRSRQVLRDELLAKIKCLFS